MQKLMPPVLKTCHALTETADDYAVRYGYIGAALHAAVVKLRQTTLTTSASQTPAAVTCRAAAALPFLQVRCFSVFLL